MNTQHYHCDDPACSGHVELDHESRDRATGAYYAEGHCNKCGLPHYEDETEMEGCDDGACHY